MITLGNHGSGDPTGSPDEGLYDPTPKTTALLPEGHNLLHVPSGESSDTPVEPTFQLGEWGGGLGAGTVKFTAPGKFELPGPPGRRPGVQGGPGGPVELETKFEGVSLRGRREEVMTLRE